ncbi:MAG: nicotianamine synthase family protein [Myxococcota bacterium]
MKHHPVRSPFGEPAVASCAVDAQEISSAAHMVLRRLVDGPTSVYQALTDHIVASQSPFEPCPTVNGALRGLVKTLQGEGLAEPEEIRAVHAQALTLLQQVEEWQDRAHTVRDFAGRAEAALERAYAPTLAVEHSPSATPLARLCDALGPFPYLENYQRLVEAESRLLRGVRHVWFGGAGPAPLTGLLLHATLGVRVTLVDVDAEAVEVSQALVTRLERMGALIPGFVQTRHADLRDGIDTDDVDALLIASLVDEEAKVQVAQHVATKARRPRLLFRSARGLCSAFAYRPTPRARIEAAGWRFVGHLAPETQASVRDPEVLAIVDRRILNSTEVFVAQGREADRG